MENSPLAKVPYIRRGSAEYLEMLVKTPQLYPQTHTVATANGLVLTQVNGTVIRYLQNVGTVPVKWKFGGAPTSDDFSGVLAACSTADDGTSPVLDISSIYGDIYILGVGGTPRVVAVQICDTPNA